MPRKPLASARIPQEWATQIQAICHTTGRTQSEIVQDAIAEYLEQAKVNPAIPSEKRLSAIESKIEQFFQLTQLAQKGSQIQPKSKPRRSKSSSKRPKPAPKPPEPPSEGEYSLKDICERYGWSYHNFRRNAGLKKQTLLQYLRERSGIDWGESNGRYAPPDTKAEA